MQPSRVLSGVALLAALVVAQPVAAGTSSSSSERGPIETVRVAPGGSVRIVVTGAACRAGKIVIVSGKPIASSVRRNGSGIVRVRAEPGRIHVSFTVPADTRAGRYPVTMRCLRSAADTVGRLIPGAKVIVAVTS